MAQGELDVYLRKWWIRFTDILRWNVVVSCACGLKPSFSLVIYVVRFVPKCDFMCVVSQKPNKQTTTWGKSQVPWQNQFAFSSRVAYPVDEGPYERFQSNICSLQSRTVGVSTKLYGVISQQTIICRISWLTSYLSWPYTTLELVKRTPTKFLC